MIKIALDPGHFGGSLAKIEGRYLQLDNYPPIKEGDLNLKVALKLKYFINNVCEVLITRDSFENFNHNFSKKEFEEFKLKNWNDRIKKIKNFNPDLTIAIHFNATQLDDYFTETKHNGVMVFIYDKNDKDTFNKAKIIAKHLSLRFNLPFCKKDWFLEDISKNWKDLGDGVNERNLFILKNIRSNIILTEGPMMNNKDFYLELIKNEDKIINTYATALKNSIFEIFNL